MGRIQSQGLGSGIGAVAQIDWDKDGHDDARLMYIKHPRPTTREYISDLFIVISIVESNMLYWIAGGGIFTNESSSTVPPILLSESGQLQGSWTTNITLWDAHGIAGGVWGYGATIGENRALVFGFTVARSTGRHFGWARVQGANGVNV